MQWAEPWAGAAAFSSRSQQGIHRAASHQYTGSGPTGNVCPSFVSDNLQATHAVYLSAVYRALAQLWQCALLCRMHGWLP